MNMTGSGGYQDHSTIILFLTDAWPTRTILKNVLFIRGLSGPFYNYTLSYRRMTYPDHLTSIECMERRRIYRMNRKEGFRVWEKRRMNMTGSGLTEEKNG